MFNQLLDLNSEKLRGKLLLLIIDKLLLAIILIWVTSCIQEKQKINNFAFEASRLKVEFIQKQQNSLLKNFAQYLPKIEEIRAIDKSTQEQLNELDNLVSSMKTSIYYFEALDSKTKPSAEELIAQLENLNNEIAPNINESPQQQIENRLPKILESLNQLLNHIRELLKSEAKQ